MLLYTVQQSAGFEGQGNVEYLKTNAEEAEVGKWATECNATLY